MKGLGRIPTTRDKHEFCYMYRDLFKQIRYIRKWDNFRRHPVVKEIAILARKYFGYADSYYQADIARNLLHHYKRLI